MTSKTNVWFITGCSSGIGEALALAARKHGDIVIATARNVNALAELKKQGCDTLSLDTTSDDETVKKVVAEAVGLHGRIDILVNNAGIFAVGAVEETRGSEVEQMFRTNVFGMIAVTRAVVPYMRAQGFGTIANIGSMANHIVFPYGSVYSATKSALASISNSLLHEVAPFGIKVVNIEPGSFKTKISTSGVKYTGETLPEYETIRAPMIGLYTGIAQGAVGSPLDTGVELMFELLTGTGRAAGRELPARISIGGETFEPMEAALTSELKELHDWADFGKPAIFE